MAQKTIVKTYDDLDGSEIDAEGKSVSFSLDGTTYEIDLSSKNVEKMRADFRVYIEKARKVNARAGRASSRTAEPAPLDTKAVRAWAEGQGLEVSARGRLSSELIEQYRAAH